ncbi:MAG TPA: hypothetical protein VIL00_04135 [Pseudonocardiaceae bacterium]
MSGSWKTPGILAAEERLNRTVAGMDQTLERIRQHADALREAVARQEAARTRGPVPEQPVRNEPRYTEVEEEPRSFLQDSW